jgi:hypothetical protein
MISFAITKLDPMTCNSCSDCVRKNTGVEFCNSFCRINEQIIYTCPFCGNEGKKIGMRNSVNPVVCIKCCRELNALDEMSRSTGVDTRVSYHRKLHIYVENDH